MKIKSAYLERPHLENVVDIILFWICEAMHEERWPGTWEGKHHGTSANPKEKQTREMQT